MVYITIINETNYKILFQPTKMVIKYDKIGDHSFDRSRDKSRDRSRDTGYLSRSN